MKEEILLLLQKIEKDNNVRILFACESGSRAWGFESTDSDYDVRFIYLRPLEFYLSIKTYRDVIEHDPDGVLDCNGWDLRKALQLFRKSNPPLFEWLGSPIIYLEQSTIADKMRALGAEYYSPQACTYHYIHMAQGNYREYLKGDQVWIKKYFYVLRPILAVNWLERGLGVVPTEFCTLVEGIVKSEELKLEIQKLLDLKRNGAELDYGPRIETISSFVESELARFEKINTKVGKPESPLVPLDTLFREALSEVWGKIPFSMECI